MQFDWVKLRSRAITTVVEARALVARPEHRGRIRLGLALISVWLLWQGIDVAPRLFFDTRKFQAALEANIDQSRLAISYQGFDISFFRGIRIIGLRVSFDRDFSRGRYSVEAPFAYVKLPMSTLWGGAEASFSDARLTLEAATLSYWITSDAGDREFLVQFREILQLTRRYHLECNDCHFQLNVKDNSYFREITPVEKLFFTLRHDGKEVQALVRYESSILGNGDFFGKFAACDSNECNNLEGYWYFKPAGLNVSVFNNFQKSYTLADGLASGELAFDRRVQKAKNLVRGKEVDESQVLSNFRMALVTQNLLIQQKKQDWYRAKTLAVDAKMQVKNFSASGAVDMILDGHTLHVDFDGLRGDALPEKYAFRIQPKLFSDKPLELPGQISLTGLKNFSVELAGKRNERYSQTDASFELSDAVLRIARPGGPLDVKIPVAQVKLSQENLTGNVTLQGGTSSVTGILSGVVRLAPVAFRPLADPLLRERAGAAEQKIFTLQGKIVLPLVSENIFWKDVKPFINAWLDDYWREVESGIQYSWLPSNMVRREYFVRFVQNLDFSMPIEIKNFEWSQKTPLKGLLYFSPAYAGGGIKLETPDGLNSNQVTFSFGQENAPWVTHSLQLNLPESYDLLTPWFGRDFFEHFSSVSINHQNNFYGERPADHYLKSESGTQLKFKRLRLGPWARAQNLPLQWETAELQLNQSGGQGRILTLTAGSESNSIYGYGDYRLFDRQVETTLKYTLGTR